MEDKDYKTYTAPEVIDAKPLYTEQPKQKSNTWWIILLVVLLVLCCCVVIGGLSCFTWFPAVSIGLTGPW